MYSASDWCHNFQGEPKVPKSFQTNQTFQGKRGSGVLKVFDDIRGILDFIKID